MKGTANLKYIFQIFLENFYTKIFLIITKIIKKYFKLTIQITEKNSFKSKRFENEPNPVFNFKSQFSLDVRKTVARGLNAVVEIWDDDTVGSDVAGQITIPLAPIIGEANSVVTRDYNLIHKSAPQELRGIVKISLRFVPDVNCEKVQDLKSNSSKVSGSLALNILNGKNLAKSSFLSGAPALYVSHRFSDSQEDNKSKQRTKSIENVNPEWNYKTVVPLKDVELTELRFKRVEFVLMRDDTFSADDELGALTLSIENLVNNPGSWANQYFLIEGKDRSEPSWLGVQAQWRPDGGNL